jgi:hypothetical protein
VDGLLTPFNEARLREAAARDWPAIEVVTALVTEATRSGAGEYWMPVGVALELPMQLGDEARSRLGATPGRDGGTGHRPGDAAGPSTASGGGVCGLVAQPADTR